jgi:hypothetical protein
MVKLSTFPPVLILIASAASSVNTPLTKELPTEPYVVTFSSTVRFPMGLLTWMPIEPSPWVVRDLNVIF